MADYMQRYSDRQMDQLERRIGRVYAQAAREIQRKFDDFKRQHEAIDRQMQADLAAGKITDQDYRNWLRNQVFTGDRWRARQAEITRIYQNADREARRMVGETDKDIFAEAANRQAYETERDVLGAVSFDLYDRSTVDRLVRDNPQMLPEWKINEPKDYKWNYQRVNNAVTQGIVQGESVYDIGKRLTRELSASNASHMDMFARTAVTGAQNAGRVERMREADERFGLKAKKMWVTAHDGRVRDTHDELDGQTVGYDDTFTLLDGRTISYPGDPTADADLVYNCRCTLIYVPDDGIGDFSLESHHLPEYDSYNEWKKGKEYQKPDVQVETDEKPEAQPEPDPPGVAEDIRRAIREHEGSWSTDDLCDIGQKMQAEIDKKADAIRQDLDTQIKTLRDEKLQLMDEGDKAFDELFEAQAAGNKELYAEIEARHEEIYTRVDELNTKEWDLSREIAMADSEATRQFLSEVRTIGGIDQNNIGQYADWTKFGDANQPKMEEQMITAMNHYPSEWLNKSAENSISLKPHWTEERAYYNSGGEIRVSSNEATNVHELGHRFEHTVPGILEAEREFYERRTAGCDLEWLGGGYRPDELTRRDHFFSAYMGKDYGGNSYELVSMGFQEALTDPRAFKAEDPEMYQWILGILACM